MEGSGWVLRNLDFLDLTSVKYRPIAGSSYVETPEKLSKKTAIINIKNENDDMCFLYSIIASILHKKKIPTHNLRYIPYLKRHRDLVNAQMIDFPTKLSDVSKFEKANSGITISLYAWDEQTAQIYPVKVSKILAENHVNLLVLENENENKFHYTTITDLPRLLGKKGCEKAHLPILLACIR